MIHLPLINSNKPVPSSILSLLREMNQPQITHPYHHQQLQKQQQSTLTPIRTRSLSTSTSIPLPQFPNSINTNRSSSCDSLSDAPSASSSPSSFSFSSSSSSCSSSSSSCSSPCLFVSSLPRTNSGSGLDLVSPLEPASPRHLYTTKSKSNQLQQHCCLTTNSQNTECTSSDNPVLLIQTETESETEEEEESPILSEDDNFSLAHNTNTSTQATNTNTLVVDAPRILVAIISHRSTVPIEVTTSHNSTDATNNSSVSLPISSLARPSSSSDCVSSRSPSVSYVPSASTFRAFLPYLALFPALFFVYLVCRLAISSSLLYFVSHEKYFHLKWILFGVAVVVCMVYAVLKNNSTRKTSSCGIDDEVGECTQDGERIVIQRSSSRRRIQFHLSQIV